MIINNDTNTTLDHGVSIASDFWDHIKCENRGKDLQLKVFII